MLFMTIENRQERNLKLVNSYKEYISKGMRKGLAREKLAKKFNLSLMTVYRIIAESDEKG